MGAGIARRSAIFAVAALPAAVVLRTRFTVPDNAILNWWHADCLVRETGGDAMAVCRDALALAESEFDAVRKHNYLTVAAAAANVVAEGIPLPPMTMTSAGHLELR